MHTGEGPDSEDRQNGRGERDGQRINIGGGDDSIARIQLAARWAETYSPERGDSLNGVLARFRTAYEYLDAITHGVEPPDFEPEQIERAQSAPAPSAPPPPPPVAPPPQPQPAYGGMPTPPPPPPAPEPEHRPW